MFGPKALQSRLQRPDILTPPHTGTNPSVQLLDLTFESMFVVDELRT